jgi:hypothetical protein
MTTLSYQDFLDGVTKWATANIENIKHQWPQKGGWENWAQGDIYSYFIKQNSTFDILREQAVYTNSALKADFLLNSKSAGAQKVIIELKCQSLENYQSFDDGLITDTKKILGIAPAYHGSALIVLGFYFTQAKTAIPSHFDSKVLPGNEIGICWAIDLNS